MWHGLVWPDLHDFLFGLNLLGLFALLGFVRYGPAWFGLALLSLALRGLALLGLASLILSLEFIRTACFACLQLSFESTYLAWFSWLCFAWLA